MKEIHVIFKVPDEVSPKTDAHLIHLKQEFLGQKGIGPNHYDRIEVQEV